MQTVLIVEDYDDQRVIIVEMLKLEGKYNIIEATNGKDALEKFDLHKIDIVVCDLILPHLNGINVIQQMIALNPRIKVVAISGGTTEALNDYIEIQEKRLASTLSKPFTRAELLNAIQCETLHSN